MQESFLQFVWQYQYFDRTDLKTTKEEKITVINPGMSNTNAGPDFSNAKIMIGGIEWNGNAEIHIKSSDWHRHHHSTNTAYDNVVVHVVWEDDHTILHKDGTPIPTVELKDRIDETLILKYKKLVNNPDVIPCASTQVHVSELNKIAMLEKALMTRLESKAKIVMDICSENNHDWEQTAYQVLAMNFGFKINKDTFLALSETLPYKIIAKHSDSLLQIEALLFGQAGFLEKDEEDEYMQRLKKEYEFLSHKYGIYTRRLMLQQWKFMRLRPANFPTLRIAQFATLLYHAGKLFAKLIETQNMKAYQKLIMSQPSEYWEDHYQFGKGSIEKTGKIGKSSVENVVINTVIPLLVAYGKARDLPEMVDKAIVLLEGIKAEKNKVTKLWESLGFGLKSAADSQGLTELYNNFCLKKRCLNCNIGMELLKKQAD